MSAEDKTDAASALGQLGIDSRFSKEASEDTSASDTEVEQIFTDDDDRVGVLVESSIGEVVEGDSKIENSKNMKEEASPAQSRRNEGRDISVSTLMNLIDVPTRSQVSNIEVQMDIFAAKFTSLHAKIDRVSSELNILLLEQSRFARIEPHLNEIKLAMKKFFPEVFRVSVGASAKKQKETEIIIQTPEEAGDDAEELSFHQRERRKTELEMDEKIETMTKVGSEEN